MNEGKLISFLSAKRSKAHDILRNLMKLLLDMIYIRFNNNVISVISNNRIHVHQKWHFVIFNMRLSRKCSLHLLFNGGLVHKIMKTLSKVTFKVQFSKTQFA